MKRLTHFAAIGALVLLSFAVLPARAQDAEQPDTGVARISLIRGDVLLTRGDSGDQVQTSVNSPLVRGDKITTGDKSQTEIQLDHSNIIRLAPGSEVRIADLTRKQIQLQVARGLVNYTVLKTNEAEIEIDTPNMAVRPIKEGSYRVQVSSPTETHLIVRKGDADVTTPQGTERVEDGRMITVRGTDNPEFQVAKAPGRDDWDKWNSDRDNAIKDAKSYKYANRYYTGAQDLDRNGRWEYIPDYGDYAWTPYANAGWAPYSSGYWGWQPYWGWTWVSYEPWGWAPYHYGRWFHRGSSWYWWPGQHYYGNYPTWGPGWVSWIGFGYSGHNWGFGFGYGYNSVGWCALGPYDNYYPWWGHHNSYNSVNITNITNITNVTNIRNGTGQFGKGGFHSNLETALTNSNVRNGITRVGTEDFVRGNFSRAQRGLDANTLREGQLVQGRIPAAPTRETLRPVDNNSRITRTSGTDNFFSRRQAPAVSRNFNEQAASVQNMMRTDVLGATSSRREGTSNGAATTGGSTGDSAARSAASGFAAGNRGLGNSGATSSNATAGRTGTLPGGATAASGTAASSGAASASSAPGTRSSAQTGWQRFGRPTSGGTAQAGGSTAASGGTAVAPGAAPQGTRPSGQSVQPSGQSTQPAPQQGRGWQRFGNGQPRVDPGRPTTTGTAPGAQAAPGRTTQGNTSGASQGTRGSGVAPARIDGGGYTSPQRGEAAPSSGWRRFGARSDSSGNAERPALGIRKSITTERAAPRTFERGLTSGGPTSGVGNSPAAPRSFESGSRPAPLSFGRSQTGGERTAPSPTPRSFEGSGGRAAPSGGGSASPRSFERSGGGGYTGGGRNGSGPSGGGSMRSAPSAPSPSYGGYSGGRSMSAPSGGGGGGRGASAPSGSGGGGGRSSGSSSHGGGQGRR